MAREDAYQLGYMYGSDGLTPEQFKALIAYYMRAWSEEVASEFSRGYHDHIRSQLHD